MTAQVPNREIGTASAGMKVADAERRNRKITRMTRETAIRRVSSTSATAWRIEIERSIITLIETDGGICARNAGNFASTESTTATVLASGCFWIARTTALSLFSHVAILSFSTLS